VGAGGWLSSLRKQPSNALGPLLRRGSRRSTLTHVGPRTARPRRGPCWRPRPNMCKPISVTSVGASDPLRTLSIASRSQPNAAERGVRGSASTHSASTTHLSDHEPDRRNRTGIRRAAAADLVTSDLATTTGSGAGPFEVLSGFTDATPQTEKHSRRPGVPPCEPDTPTMGGDSPRGASGSQGEFQCATAPDVWGRLGAAVLGPQTTDGLSGASASGMSSTAPTPFRRSQRRVLHYSKLRRIEALRSFINTKR